MMDMQLKCKFIEAIYPRATASKIYYRIQERDGVRQSQEKGKNLTNDNDENPMR